MQVGSQVFHEFCPNGTLPSGKTFEDMLLFVRQKMFVHLLGAKNNKSNSKKKDDPAKSLTEEEMPGKWMFNGWLVFVLYGTPEGLTKNSLSCLSENGKDVPKDSRSSARASEAKLAADERRTHVGSRGISVQDRVTLVTLSQSEFRDETKNIRELLAICNAQETNTLNSLKLTCSMLAEADNEQEKKYHRKRKLQLLERLEELDDRKRRLERESDQLLLDAKNKKQELASRILPKQITVDDTTTNSSVSQSASSSRKSGSDKELPNPALRSDSDDEEQPQSTELVIVDEDDEESSSDSDLELSNGQDSLFLERSVVTGPQNQNKNRTSVCAVEQQLGQRSIAVLNAFRERNKENN